MSSFEPYRELEIAPPVETTKHVKFNFGMVLGVDDFIQEFSYLSGRHQWLARDLLGYGTVSGLSVRTETKDGHLQLWVDPGVAATPRGQLVRIPVDHRQVVRQLALHLDSVHSQLVVHDRNGVLHHRIDVGRLE